MAIYLYQCSGISVRLLVFFLALVFCTHKITAQNKTVQTNRSNVILIVLDDMNDYGISGSQNVITPNLDRLRNRAITFTNANCPAPLCMSSRASFFTGIYPHKSGVYRNGGDPWNQSNKLKNAETLPELFRRNGYYSYGAGKIFHAQLEKGRIEQNFDNHPIKTGGFGPFPDKDHRNYTKKDRFPDFWGVQAFKDSMFPDVINTNDAISFLEQKQEKPFFMVLGLWRPHTPFTAPQRFFDLYNTNEIRIPEGYLANDLDDIPSYMKNLLDPFGRFEITGINNVEKWKHFIHGYYACSSFADWNVGKLINALEKSSYDKNTILIVCSDNGFHVGTKNHWEKNTLWNSSAIVPLLIKMPESIENGRVIDTPVNLIDLYPTLVEICQLEQPQQKLDGKSLLPYLMRTDYISDRPALISLGEGLFSLQMMEYRYIQYPDGSAELYNYRKDPYEWYNLIDNKKYEHIVQDIKKHIPLKFEKALPGRVN